MFGQGINFSGVTAPGSTVDFVGAENGVTQDPITAKVVLGNNDAGLAGALLDTRFLMLNGNAFTIVGSGGGSGGGNGVFRDLGTFLVFQPDQINVGPTGQPYAMQVDSEVDAVVNACGVQNGDGGDNAAAQYRVENQTGTGHAAFGVGGNGNVDYPGRGYLKFDNLNGFTFDAIDASDFLFQINAAAQLKIELGAITMFNDVVFSLVNPNELGISAGTIAKTGGGNINIRCTDLVAEVGSFRFFTINPADAKINWAGSTVITNNANGDVTFSDAAATGFTAFRLAAGGAYQSGQPSASGAGLWKLGKRLNAVGGVFDDARYIEVMIDGTLYQLALWAS